MRTAARRLVTVLVGAPLALGLLAATASAQAPGVGVAALTATAPVLAAAPAQAPAAAAVLTQDPIGPPTGMDPSTAPLGPPMPAVTAPDVTAPAPSAAVAALPRTGGEATVLLGVGGVLLVLAGVLLHVAARPVRSVDPRFVVRLL